MRCDIPGCPRCQFKQGLCSVHYPTGEANSITQYSKNLNHEIWELRAENKRLKKELGI